MSLRGKLETMALPEVLQWIAMTRKTGTLYLQRRSIQKRIVFNEGALYSSWSNHPRESLGQFLIRGRLVTEEQLFRALLKQEQQGQMLGAILVGEGVLASGELRSALKTKAEESIYDLFLWPDGEFEFREGEFPELIHLELPVAEVIMEGIRRVDEWSRIRAVFPSAHTTFKALAPATAAKGPEAEALALAAAGKTLAEIALEMRRSEFEAASLLYALHQRGKLQVDAVQEEPRAGDPVAAITDRLAQATARMAERRYKAAWELYEEVLSIDRLNQQAKKGLLAAAEAMERERAARTVMVDKVPVVVMDMMSLTREKLDPQEGFVLSRVNGTWDVRSILKICPLAEEEAVLIFSRLIDRRVIELR
jgi:hypothetical protein